MIGNVLANHWQMSRQESTNSLLIIRIYYFDNNLQTISRYFETNYDY